MNDIPTRPAPSHLLPLLQQSQNTGCLCPLPDAVLNNVLAHNVIAIMHPHWIGYRRIAHCVHVRHPHICLVAWRAKWVGRAGRQLTAEPLLQLALLVCKSCQPCAGFAARSRHVRRTLRQGRQSTAGRSHNQEQAQARVPRPGYPMLCNDGMLSACRLRHWLATHRMVSEIAKGCIIQHHDI